MVELYPEHSEFTLLLHFVRPCHGPWTSGGPLQSTVTVIETKGGKMVPEEDSVSQVKNREDGTGPVFPLDP